MATGAAWSTFTPIARAWSTNRFRHALERDLDAGHRFRAFRDVLRHRFDVPVGRVVKNEYLGHVANLRLKGPAFGSRFRTGVMPIRPLLRPDAGRTPALRRPSVGERQRLFVADAHAVAFAERHAVDRHAAACHVHVGKAVRRQFQRRAFIAVEQARVDPRVLPDLQRTGVAFGETTRASLPRLSSAVTFVC